MASSSLEKRTTMVSTGRLPSSKLLELSTSRPFVHQVDVAFPFDRELQAAFSKLETDYYTSRAPLAEIYESLRTYNQESGLSNDAQVASTGTFLPDAWSCWEGRVILNAGKETFEALGLPGAKIHARMPGAPEQHLINVSLSNIPGANIRSHDFILDSFTRWDQSRERSGEGQWDFAFHLSHPDKGTGPLSLSRSRRHEVKPVIQNLQNVCIPTSGLSPRPNPRSTSTGRRGRRDLLHSDETPTDADEDDAMQDWNERANSLFEWIGMVNIGAQRLQANDRVEPYVAVYSAPAPCTVGDMAHIRWHGFLTPRFVQRVIDTATKQTSTSQSMPLIGLTIHGSTWVPELTPLRVPRLEGEDTAGVILAPEGTGDAMAGEPRDSDENNLTGSWVMLESIGKWDSRFG